MREAKKLALELLWGQNRRGRRCDRDRERFLQNEDTRGTARLQLTLAVDSAVIGTLVPGFVNCEALATHPVGDDGRGGVTFLRKAR